MAFNVETFRSSLVADGARPNLFQIELAFPPVVQNAGQIGGSFGGNRASTDISFLANSTQLPPSIIGVARLNYFGREVKFPGDRVFPDWSINVINDETFGLKNAFELWSNALNSNSGIVRERNSLYYLNYTTEAYVSQFSKNGSIVKKYKFVGVFPSQVDPINVAWNANDQIEEFGVTFSYQYWEDVAISGPTTTPRFFSPVI